MVISYAEALDSLKVAAAELNASPRLELIPTMEMVGRVAARDVLSPISTPAADTAAMDGYAVASYLTTGASAKQPVHMTVEATVAAGHRHPKLTTENNRWKKFETGGLADGLLSNDGLPPCVEIMTGARFPPPVVKAGQNWHLDACVKIEDVTVLVSASDQKRLIRMTKPVPPSANRRYASEDFCEKDLIVESGQVLRHQHVMAMASVGLAQILVHRSLRVGIITTGDEVVSHDADARQNHIHDANAPLLMTTLRTLGVEVVNLGIVKDNMDDFIGIVRPVLQECQTDIIVSTGGVSCGKFDFVKDAFILLGGKIKFHHVAVRPGHPILFGTIHSVVRPSSDAAIDKSVAYFGLPGNPLAAAACLRFFVVPFLQLWHGIASESGTLSKLNLKASTEDSHRSRNAFSAVMSSPPKYDIFRLGLRSADGLVELVDGQASHKVRPLLRSNCWVVVPAVQAISPGQFVKTLPLFLQHLDD